MLSVAALISPPKEGDAAGKNQTCQSNGFQRVRGIELWGDIVGICKDGSLPEVSSDYSCFPPEIVSETQE